MSGPVRPKATKGSYATASSSSKFDVRNPSALAADANDADYDAETTAILSLDEIGASSRGVKRNAVNLDGYDSDSSNEGFTANDDSNGKKTSKKPAAGADNEADDGDDMFGGEDEEEEEAAAQAENTMNRKKNKKKDVRFLELDEIEGQDFGSKRGYEDVIDEPNSAEDSEEDEEEVDEEIGAGGKKKNAPKLDGFNMKAEMDEGRFDDQGNFVRKAADTDAVHDAWLQGVSRKDMKKALEAKVQREQEAKQKLLEEDAIVTSDVIAGLIVCLERGETVLESLARLKALADGGKKGAAKPKKSWQQKRKEKANGAMDVDDAASKEKEKEDPKEIWRKQQIDKITTAANILLDRGNMDIYEESREGLTRLYRRESGETWEEPSTQDNPSNGGAADDVDGKVIEQWEYKWTDGRDEEGKLYGPYSSENMKAWEDAGFFGEGVAFRRVGEGEADWSRVGEFR